MFLVLAATASTAGLFAHPPSGHGSKVHHVSHFPRWRFVFCFQQVDGVTRHAERVLEFAAAILVALVSTLNRSDITWIESNAAKKKKKQETSPALHIVQSSQVVPWQQQSTRYNIRQGPRDEMGRTALSFTVWKKRTPLGETLFPATGTLTRKLEFCRLVIELCCAVLAAWAKGNRVYRVCPLATQLAMAAPGLLTTDLGRPRIEYENAIFLAVEPFFFFSP